MVVSSLVSLGLKDLTISPSVSFLWDLFKLRPANCNLRIKELAQLPSVKAVRYGLNSLKFRGSMLWNTLHDTIQDSYGFWKVMKLDNAIFQDLESFGKERLFKMVMEKLLIFI